MAKIRFSLAVVADLADAIAWYDAKSIALGDCFRAAADVAFDAIERSPELSPFAFRDLNIRFHRLNRFPYLVLYRVAESEIVVIGIWHGASDPKKWRRRATET